MNKNVCSLGVGQESTWICSEGKVHLMKEGYICLNCVYMQCRCGSPRWAKLEQKLPKPKFKHSYKQELLDKLRYLKLFYVRDVRDKGNFSVSRSSIETELVLELLGYSCQQRNELMAGWVAEYEQAMLTTEAEGLALRQWQVTPIQVGAAEKYQITNFQGQCLLNEKGQPRTFADFKQAVLTMQAENKAVA